MNFPMAMDAEGSVRTFDDNGNMHVSVSHLTKAQVRPYRGSEIPGWERLRLDPMKVYFGYCPPEELAKPETVKSVNAIPIQLEHHPDYADDPQLLTRIGTTGTDGAFRDPYLDNSLHFTVRKAIDRIQDGSMRELSLAYRYTPDFTAGTTPDGKDYDFVMRDISANHVALVELGRAGRDVLVEDHQMEDIKMEDDKKLSGDDNPVVEETEVALADKIKDAAEQITDLHTEDGEGNVVDNPAEDDGDDKVAIAKAVLADLAAKGLTLEDLAAAQGAADDGEDLPQDEACEAEDEDENLLQDALESCGLDNASPEEKKAFAAGMQYQAKQEETEGAAQDSEEEAPAAEPAMGQDAAMKAVEKRIAARFGALDECKKTLGKVRFDAFDSAEAVYMAALRQEGLNTKGMSPKSAKAAYRAFMAGRKKSSRVIAQDSAFKHESELGKKLAKIHKGV